MEQNKRNSPLLFCLAGARSPQAGEADSVKPCPTRGGHPKGLGLEGIRGVSYAPEQKRVLNLSGTGPTASRGLCQQPLSWLWQSARTAIFQATVWQTGWARRSTLSYLLLRQGLFRQAVPLIPLRAGLALLA